MIAAAHDDGDSADHATVLLALSELVRVALPIHRPSAPQQ